RNCRKTLPIIIQEATASPTDQMVSSFNHATHHSRSFFTNLFESIDFIEMIKKRIEADAGASVAAVFDLCNDLLRLNLVMGILLLAGITIPALVWQKSDPVYDLENFNLSSFSNVSLPSSRYSSRDFWSDWTTQSSREESSATDQLWGWRTIEDLQSESSSMILENDTSLGCSGVELTDTDEMVQRCSIFYIESQKMYTSERNSVIDNLLDFLQGLGFLERTALFIGWYSAELTSSSSSYHVASAYFLTVAVAYLISVGYVVRGFGRWLRSRSKILDYTHLFNEMVFTGWDFNITNKRTAELEKNLLIQQIKAAETEEAFRRERSKRTISEKRKLFAVRLLIHILTIALIGGGWVAIYFLVTRVKGDSFWAQYATTITISGLNFVLPPIFFVLSWYEHYTLKSTLLLYIMRNIFLRIISIVILVGSEISGRIQDSEYLVDACNRNNPCWETHVVQQLYSLILFDTLIYIPITISVFIRYFLGFVRDDHPLVSWQPKIVWEFLSQPEFDTAGHVLRAVHLQTLCWMGMVNAPILPLMTVVAFFIMISLNGITIKYCDLRPSVAFRSSASSSMFMVAAIIGLLLSVVPSVLTLTWFKPSLGCSPFRGLQYPYQVVVNAICHLPDWIKDTLFYLSEFVPLALALLVVTSALVYYVAQMSAWQVRQRYYEQRIKKFAYEKKALI
ncbi:TMC protein, partial [Trinorchestia longiramus]